MKRYTIIIGVLLLFFYRSLTYLDPDFGWHLRAGQYILNQGIPEHDIFTYTAASFMWINHEWLHDLIVALLYNVGGYTLLAAFFAILWTGVLLLASRNINWFLGTLASLALYSYAGVRPMVWSFLFFALLERVVEGKERYYKWFLPLLFLLWSNLHGGFFLGLIILGGHIFLTRKISPRYLFIPVFLVTLINPYGIRLYEEIFRTLFDGYIHLHISEWQPFIFTAYAIFYISVFFSLFLMIHKKNTLKSLPRLPFILFIMSLMSTRNTPFFIISSLRYGEIYLQSLLKKIPKKLTGGRLMTWRLIQIVAIGVIVYGYISLVIFSQKEEDVYPKKAAAYLNTHACKGNLFNNYDYGGYLIWKAPKEKVYIDGRMPSWQSASTTYLQEYLRILSDEVFRKKQFTKYSIRCALLKKEDKLTNILIKEGWRPIIEEKKSVLLIDSASHRSL